MVMANLNRPIDLVGGESSNILQSDKMLKYLESLAECMPGNFYWKDTQGKYLGCNTLLLKTLKLEKMSDIIGKTDYELWPNQVEQLMKHDKMVIDLGQSINLEEETIMPDGRHMYFTVIKTPLRDEQGKIIGVIGNSLDITDRKLAEETAKQAMELAEAAERKAQKANINKSNYMLAADRILRTPLGNALGAAQLLQNYVLPNEAIEPVDIIISSIEEVPPVLKRLRDYISLMDGNMQVFPPYVAKLEDMFKKLVATYRPQIEAKGLRFNFEYSNGLPEWVNGCLSEISDVLRHLLHKAVKYTTKGVINLNVGHKMLSPDDILLIVTVKDTGQGIKPQTLSCLFNFLDQDSVTSGFTKGGLVLSMCAKIIERLQGTLKVDSKLKEGTTFTLTVPLAITQAPTYKSILKHSTVGQTPPKIKRPYDSPVRYLIVEDNMISQRMLTLTLNNKYNCTVVSAYTLEEALKHIYESFDMILLDINLPDGTGIEFLRALMQALGPKAPPVIAITSFVNDDEKDEIFAAGAVEVLEKPVDQNVLEDLINACVFEDLTDD